MSVTPKIMRAFSRWLCFGLLIVLAVRADAFQTLEPLPIAPAIAMTDKTLPPAISPAATSLVAAQLEAAVKDLQMPSETDAPFRVVFYPSEAKPDPETEGKTEGKPDETPAPELIAKLAGAPDDAKIETRDLDDFFANTILSEDWMEDDEKATAKRFAELVEVLKKLLGNPQVVVWGDAQKQVAIIGTVEGGLAGVLTIVVET